MKLHNKNTAKILSLILLLSGVILSPQLQAQIGDLDAIKIEANKIAAYYENLGWFSGSLLLAKDGNVFHQASFSYSNIESKVKNTSLTKYNLGSIVKNFTAVLILQEVENKKLSLGDTLSKFDLGFPAVIANKITIRHLLDHRSGFDDIFTAEYRQDQMAFDTLEKKLTLLRDKPLLFEPDSDYKYSNYGYVVLGAILEKLNKKSYENLLRKNIFDKVGLANSTFLPSHEDKNQSTRYTYNYAGELSEVGITEHAGPDGGIESTASDLQLFYRELFYGSKLLSREKGVLQEVFAVDGEHWGAYGGGLGVSAAIEVDLLNGMEVVVLSNTDNLVAERISGRILSFIKEGEYTPIRILPSNFAYQYYKEHGFENFRDEFKSAYKAAGYESFIGGTLNELGMQLIRTESWDQAFDIFNSLVSFFPDAPQVYDSLAFAYYSKGEFEKARSIFAKGAKLKTDFVSDYNGKNYQ
ncbi:MAG: CubicO group peptidase (beta-lactamase class C family) [Paraglaciecola sp.]|jgi:CubicO group peptidase (beta-lactamase class C family)